MRRLRKRYSLFLWPLLMALIAAVKFTTGVPNLWMFAGTSLLALGAVWHYINVDG